MNTEATSTRNPLVTFALFAFNQEAFIAAAIAGALAQTYSPLQIILTDDCSSDATFDIMQQMAREYSGPHQIVLNRNATNIGIGSHINRVMELASGEWVVGAAGDDISTPNRTAEIMKVAQRKDIKPMSIWSRAQHMKSGGELIDIYESSDGKRHTLKEMISNKKVVMGCSHAWRSDIFKLFGPLYHKVIFEDNAISFRSYLLGDIAYIDETLVHYRQHADNVTNYSKDIHRDELVRKMAKRRQYAIVGIYQRLLDMVTFKELRPESAAAALTTNKMLMRQLMKQNFKMNLARSIPSVDNVSMVVRKLIGAVKR